jgi:uncharacterized protein (DUF1778 family)
MTDTLTIDLSDDEAREIMRAARAFGQTPEAFVAGAAARQARALIEAQAFFANRSKGADLDAFDRIMSREGGEPPGEGDDAD